MSVYDPFGMLADLMIHGKILLQNVWRSGIHWNDLLPDNLFSKLRHWVLELKKAKQFL